MSSLLSRLLFLLKSGSERIIIIKTVTVRNTEIHINNEFIIFKVN